jgi:GTP cyclohydrolase III
MKKFPATFVRTSTIIELANNFDVEEHARDIERIRREYAGQIKICGNITKKVIDEVKAGRYDVTVDQAKNIIKECNDIKKQEQLAEMEKFKETKEVKKPIETPIEAPEDLTKDVKEPSEIQS